MKILWVADFGVQHNIGGAQRSDEILVKEGRAQGHDITFMHFDSAPELLNIRYDVVVSANLESLVAKFPNLVDWISAQPVHIRLEHDANRYLHPTVRKKLFKSCKKTIFLSNFHHAQFVHMYGDFFQNVSIVVDPIDTTHFYDKGLKRSPRILYVGFFHHLKGTLDFFDYVVANPDIDFSVAGWGSPVFEYLAKSLDNVQFYGKMPHHQMSDFYNMHSELYYRPAFYEPFCRSVAEALLCGVKIKGNNLIGSLHHFNEVGRDQFKTDCSEAPSVFWKEVEQGCR